jgi:O-antigen ligase
MIQQIKEKKWAIILGVLCITYFAIQPFSRHIADIFWITLSLTSIAFLIITKIKGQPHNTPKPLKHLLLLCALMPIVSIISYIASPLDLPINLLEPDLRWWLVIPIILAMRANHIGPVWIISFLVAYSASTFISAGLETNWYTHMTNRANGDENAVPYGMFNSTISALLLVVFVSSYVKQISTSNKMKYTLRGVILAIASLALLAAVASGTRAALILIPITIIFIYLTHYPLKKSISISAIIVISLSAGLYFSPPNAVKQKLTHAYDNTYNFFAIGDRKSKLTSMGQRLEQWKESWCIFKITPLTGSGPRSFSEAHQTYGGPSNCDATQYRAHGDYQAHSLYFNQLGTLGILGILSMGYWFIYATKLSWGQRNSKNNIIKLGASMMLIVILCFLVNGITLDLWFKNHVMDKHLLIWALPLLLMFYRPEPTILNK